MNHVHSQTGRQPGSAPWARFSPCSYISCWMVLNNSLPFRSSTFVNGILRDNIGKGIDSFLFVKNQGLSWAWCGERLWSQDLESWCGRIRNWRPTWTTYPASKNQTNQANKAQSKSKQVLRDCFYCYLAISFSRQGNPQTIPIFSNLWQPGLHDCSWLHGLSIHWPPGLQNLLPAPIIQQYLQPPRAELCSRRLKRNSWHFIKKLATFPASELNLGPGEPSVAWGVC